MLKISLDKHFWVHKSVWKKKISSNEGPKNSLAVNIPDKMCEELHPRWFSVSTGPYVCIPQKTALDNYDLEDWESTGVKSCTVHISAEWHFCFLHCFQCYRWGRPTAPWEGKDSAAPGGGRETLQAGPLCPERTYRTPHMLWEEKHMCSAASVREMFVARGV